MNDRVTNQLVTLVAQICLNQSKICKVCSSQLILYLMLMLLLLLLLIIQLPNKCVRNPDFAKSLAFADAIRATSIDETERSIDAGCYCESICAGPSMRQERSAGGNCLLFIVQHNHLLLHPLPPIHSNLLFLAQSIRSRKIKRTGKLQRKLNYTFVYQIIINRMSVRRRIRLLGEG